MRTREVIEAVLGSKRLAVIGVSRDSRSFANSVYHALKQRGYAVVPVNPHATVIEGDQSFRSVTAVPGTIDAALIFLPPPVAATVLPEIVEAGIKRVWFQQGTESSKALEFCAANGIEGVAGECVLMFLEPLGFPHRLHRWIKKVTHTLPV